MFCIHKLKYFSYLFLFYNSCNFNVSLQLLLKDKAPHHSPYFTYLCQTYYVSRDWQLFAFTWAIRRKILSLPFEQIIRGSLYNISNNKTEPAESVKPIKCVTLGSGPSISTNTNIIHVF